MPNGKRRISLKDLALELGVSIATVSRALRSSPEIGQEMQERVKALAKGIGQETELSPEPLCTESAQGGTEGDWRRHT